MPTRSTSLAATINGFAITRMLSAFCRSSWRLSVPEATIFVPLAPQNATTWAATTAYGSGAFVRPTVRNGHAYKATVAGTSGGSQPTWPTTNGGTVTDGGVTWTESGIDIDYNDEVVLTMGAGNNLDRFKGLFRRYDYSLFPRAIGLEFRGYLVRAAEYQNHDDPRHVGGLWLEDLLGTVTATDEAVVEAVLAIVGISFNPANIGGTGVTWGSRSLLNTQSYIWRSGTSPNVLVPLAAAGQSALDYIQSWDKVSAVYTDAVSPVGFFRTYETVNGVYRALIGGRPRGTLDVSAFTEGIDIEPGVQSSRQYPLANAAYVTGFDPGIGIGPVRNMTFDATASAGQGANIGSFLGQSSNPFQSSATSVTYDFGSPMIEWGTEAEGGIGMNCERVGNALLADLNRETVTIRFRTPRDDLVLPGYTILVQGPGGQPDRAGIGEKLWVDEDLCGIAENGAFYQEITATGGGAPDAYTPLPPG